MIHRKILDFTKYENERYITQKIKDFINDDQCYDGQILVLYGLQGTGKKTAMKQVLQTYSFPEKCAFYEVEDTDEICDIQKTIIDENENGVDIICFDEITKAADFITNSATLPDVFAKEGIRIIVTGSHSLGFRFAEDRELYDRTIRVNTTHISFAEHCNVFNTKDIDDYIQYGGLMKKGKDGSRIVFDYESACKYLNSAVSENIANSLMRNPKNSVLESLTQEELSTIIEKMVEMYSGVFNQDVIRSELKTVVTEEMIRKLEKLLREMNLLSVTTRTTFSYTDESGWEHEGDTHEYHIIQPAIKYYHLTSGKEFIEKIKGDMTEQIVIFDTSKSLPSARYSVSKPVFIINGQTKGEYGMLIYDKVDDKYWFFEIKHTTAPFHIQEKYLLNPQITEVLDKNYGSCENACVLYSGTPFITDTGTFYLNIADFLMTVDKYKDMDRVMESLIKNMRIV